MNIDQFLSFWSAHNIVIIEVLIAAILFAVGVLSHRILFAKKEEQDGASSSFDTAQIEKTLQKILDAQGARGDAKNAAASAALEPGAEIPSEESASAGAEASAEIAQLRAALQEKTAQVEQLKTQAEAATAGAPAAATAGAEGGLSADERQQLENKIKDLEARLSEYEIISEDIADLSRYKEENIRLQKELDALKGAAASAPAPAAASAPPPAETPAAPEPVATESSPAAEATAPVEEPAPASAESAPATASAEPNESAAPTGESAPAANESSNVIDDDLMKEFAAAVEGQKTGQVSNETDKLMNDFENFIKKG